MKNRYFRKALLAGALTFLSQLGFSQAVMERTRTLFQTGTSSTITRAFTATSTTGNLVIVHLSYSGQTVNIASVTDNKGNTYARINGPTNWGGINYYRSELWYAYNITGGGANLSITATLSGTPGIAPGPLQFMQIYMTEFSGIGTLDPLDQKSVSIGLTSPFDSGSAIVNYSNELIYGASIGGSAGAINAGTTFTSIDGSNNNRIEFKNGGAAGSYSATFTTALPGTYVAEMATFRTTGSVLPVSLVSFDARATAAGTAELTWITASEKNNDYFEVQRSHNGEQWEVISKIPGSGTITVKQKYVYEDFEPFQGRNYYRLNQVDFDGKNEIFKVKSVDFDVLGQSFKCYPNPAGGWIYVDGVTDSFNVKIFSVFELNMQDQIGEVVKTNHGIGINIALLPAGIYYLSTNHGSVRFVKN